MIKKILSSRVGSISIVAGVLLLLAIFVFIFGNLKNKLDDLYPNIFSELLGIGVTVILIDRILTYHEVRRDRVVKRLAIRKISYLVGWFIYMWRLACLLY